MCHFDSPKRFVSITLNVGRYTFETPRECCRERDRKNEGSFSKVQRRFVDIIHGPLKVRIHELVWYSLYLLLTRSPSMFSFSLNRAQPFKCIITYSLLCCAASCASSVSLLPLLNRLHQQGKMNCKLPHVLPAVLPFPPTPLLFSISGWNFIVDRKFGESLIFPFLFSVALKKCCPMVRFFVLFNKSINSLYSNQLRASVLS